MLFRQVGRSRRNLASFPSHRLQMTILASNQRPITLEVIPGKKSTSLRVLATSYSDIYIVQRTNSLNQCLHQAVRTPAKCKQTITMNSGLHHHRMKLSRNVLVTFAIRVTTPSSALSDLKHRHRCHHHDHVQGPNDLRTQQHGPF